ncbi:hypothetical protein DRQ21_09890 [Candidatus Fermentibacteria bacterium]|nr:MAG: hypothetical protein DRQ21_09890 [Candidatus Fermentibacteria bacterium]
MELSNRVVAAAFVMLLILFLTGRPQTVNNGCAHGVWRGKLTTVTAKGGMLSTQTGNYWVSDSVLAGEVLRGDSLLVLGYRSGMFITPFGIRSKLSGSFVSRIRRSYRDRLFNTIPDSVARGLTGGLLMGLRGLIPAGTASVFKHSGTSHLLALSGLHTGIVALVLLYLTRLVFGKGLLSGWVAVTGIIAFTVLSGGRASTVRAGIMASSVVLWLSYRGGGVHMLTLWWTALVLSLIVSPGILSDRGAQMSYGAVLSLIVFGGNPGGKFSVILAPLYAGITVTVCLVPLITAVYGGFSWTGPVATAVSLPFMLTVMALGLLNSAGFAPVSVLLNPVTHLWMQTLELFQCAPVSLSPGIMYPAWVFLLVCLRIFSRWNRFDRRFR